MNDFAGCAHCEATYRAAACIACLAILGCGPAPTTKRPADSKKLAAANKSPKNKRSVASQPPESGGLWGPPNDPQKLLTQQQVDPAKQELVDRGVVRPADGERPAAFFVGEPDDEPKKARKHRNVTGDPWPPTIRPAGGRFGKIKLPSGSTFSDQVAQSHEAAAF